jgi:hypothetical protein
MFFTGRIFEAIRCAGTISTPCPNVFKFRPRKSLDFSASGAARNGAGDPDSQTGTNGERAEVFWKEKLRALVEPTLLGDALSGASSQPAGKAPDGGGRARVQTRLSVEKTGRLARFARQEGVTPNTVLHGA